MRHSETMERGYGRARGLIVMALAATLGGVMAADESAGAEMDRKTERRAVSGVVVVALGSEAGNTVTGRIETLHGEPVAVMSSPSGGNAVRQLRDKSEVEIACQTPGANAPGDPRDFGKPPFADTTWYRITPPDGKSWNDPSCPEEWIPQNPVFTKDPVPSCPR